MTPSETMHFFTFVLVGSSYITSNMMFSMIDRSARAPVFNSIALAAIARTASEVNFSSSYSAARAALLDAWRFYRGRRDWLATYFCQPIYETWLAEAVSLGRVAAPGFFADPAIRKAWCDAEWVGDGPGSIDPLKEVSAAEKRIALGVSTVSRESVAYDGVDWRIKHKQRIVEVEERRAAGLEAELPGSSPPGPLDPGADPNADPNADPGADPSQDIPPRQ
jgi:hypothetical protein